MSVEVRRKHQGSVLAFYLVCSKVSDVCCCTWRARLTGPQASRNSISVTRFAIGVLGIWTQVLKLAQPLSHLLAQTIFKSTYLEGNICSSVGRWSSEFNPKHHINWLGGEGLQSSYLGGRGSEFKVTLGHIASQKKAWAWDLA